MAGPLGSAINHRLQWLFSSHPPASHARHSPLAMWPFLYLLNLALATPCNATDNSTVQSLEARVEHLTRELQIANEALVRAREEARSAEDQLASSQSNDDVAIGPLTVGGAVRVNYVHGDYPEIGDAPQRGGNGGNVELDTFRINLDLEYQQIRGKLEYRWYDGYNFLHTAWLGYDFGPDGELQVGLTRVPFGPGPYGISQSWFFDQHYYVGLADDMDVGVKYLHQWRNWDFAVAYFATSEQHWNGASADSARYGYDIVRWRSAIDEDGNIVSAPENGYDERNQFNLRAIYALESNSLPSKVGVSLQYGQLRGRRTDGGHHAAASVHMVNQLGELTLASQLTRYEIDINGRKYLGSDSLVPMGAYDFAWPVATDAWLPAVSLSYHYSTPGIPWLDSVTPYLEYSGILKDADLANDSEMVIIGAAWASGGWYIYTDYARSNGNLFVGSKGDNYSNIVEGVGDFGANGNNTWNNRLNINFGYYF